MTSHKSTAFEPKEEKQGKKSGKAAEYPHHQGDCLVRKQQRKILLKQVNCYRNQKAEGGGKQHFPSGKGSENPTVNPNTVNTAARSSKVISR